MAMSSQREKEMKESSCVASEACNSLSSSLSSQHNASCVVYSSFTDHFSEKTAQIRKHLEDEVREGETKRERERERERKGERGREKEREGEKRRERERKGERGRERESHFAHSYNHQRVVHQRVYESAHTFISGRHATIRSDLGNASDKMEKSFRGVANSSEDTSRIAAAASQEVLSPLFSLSLLSLFCLSPSLRFAFFLSLFKCVTGVTFGRCVTRIIVVIPNKI